MNFKNSAIRTCCYPKLSCEEKFYWGFDYFMRNTNTKLAYPMHFWGELEVIERIKNLDCAKEYWDKIAKTEWYQE